MNFAGFLGRCRAAQRIRELAQQDAELVAEVVQTRNAVVRALHERVVELEPERFAPLSGTQIEAASEAHRSAILTLGCLDQNGAVDRSTRAKLILALLTAFGER